jgi:hypothetical protein
MAIYICDRSETFHFVHLVVVLADAPKKLNSLGSGYSG